MFTHFDFTRAILCIFIYLLYGSSFLLLLKFYFPSPSSHFQPFLHLYFICLPSSPPIVLLPGVYVEKVGDGGPEGPYTGLLGIGDEILQVNGEAVAGLSLDHVTRLMTRESTASLRIMPARRNQR